MQDMGKMTSGLKPSTTWTPNPMPVEFNQAVAETTQARREDREALKKLAKQRCAPSSSASAHSARSSRSVCSSIASAFASQCGANASMSGPAMRALSEPLALQAPPAQRTLSALPVPRASTAQSHQPELLPPNLAGWRSYQAATHASNRNSLLPGRVSIARCCWSSSEPRVPGIR